jgi:hypothetical protein
MLDERMGAHVKLQKDEENRGGESIEFVIDLITHQIYL